MMGWGEFLTYSPFACLRMASSKSTKKVADLVGGLTPQELGHFFHRFRGKHEEFWALEIVSFLGSSWQMRNTVISQVKSWLKSRTFLHIYI